MKQLEDRIKDRLEGYESNLPEGDLAEFKALLEASATPGTKRSAAYLAWLAPLAVAACLALFLIFGHSTQPDNDQVVDSNSLVADAAQTAPAEIVDLAGSESVEEVAVAQTKPSCEKRNNSHDYLAAMNEEPNIEDHSSDVSEKSTIDPFCDNQQSYKNDLDEEVQRKDDGASMSSSAGFSPIVPSSNNSTKPVSIKVGQATACVLGGSGALALATILPSIIKVGNGFEEIPSYSNPGGEPTDPMPSIDTRTGDDTHHMPLRAGLSLRIPFSDRWSITTGLDYSWYASELEYSLSGIHKQSAHYLGLPMRADFTIARNSWMDVYVGAGASADFCVAAYDAGQKTTKDGVGFSLIGAGGIQFNISKNLGLFLDPTFSWIIPSEHRVLDTYRSEHPFMFSVSTGLRITLPNRYCYCH